MGKHSRGPLGKDISANPRISPRGYSRECKKGPRNRALARRFTLSQNGYGSYRGGSLGVLAEIGRKQAI
jgi:hypothetical protein